MAVVSGERRQKELMMPMYKKKSHAHLSVKCTANYNHCKLCEIFNMQSCV